MSDDDGRLPRFLTMESVLPTSFIIENGGKRVLTINRNGTIDVGEGFTPTEAGKAAIEAMRQQLAFILDAEIEACAKIADGVRERTEDDGDPWNSGCAFACEDIAAAIRARKGTP